MSNTDIDLQFVADRAIEILRKDGFDCVRKGGSYDVSNAIKGAIKQAIEEAIWLAK